MHIPDGFLDPKMSAGLLGVAGVALAYSWAKVRAAVTVLQPVAALAAAGRGAGQIVGGMRRVLTGQGERELYKMGMVAALVFAAQMFNFPIASGTSGHLIGGVLAAVLLGPFAGALVVAAVLVVQMLFFADGGLLAVGANIVNMALIGSLLCYYIYYYLTKAVPEWLAIVAAAWFSVVLASLACALQLGFSGTIALGAVVPAMLRVHVLIGIAEALITLAFVQIFRSLADGEEGGR